MDQLRSLLQGMSGDEQVGGFTKDSFMERMATNGAQCEEWIWLHAALKVCETSVELIQIQSSESGKLNAMISAYWDDSVKPGFSLVHIQDNHFCVASWDDAAREAFDVFKIMSNVADLAADPYEVRDRLPFCTSLCVGYSM